MTLQEASDGKSINKFKHNKNYVTEYRITDVNYIVNLCEEAIAELKEAQLTRREWYQKGYAEAMKPKTCKRCKTLPFVLTELSKKNGGKCGTCKRYVKDNYQAEPKEQ